MFTAGPRCQSLFARDPLKGTHSFSNWEISTLLAFFFFFKEDTLLKRGKCL